MIFLHPIGHMRLFVILVTLIGITVADVPAAENVAELEGASASGQRDLPGEVMELSDVVLDKHVDPPVRQQMLLAGLKAVFRSTGQEVPRGLARRVSQISDEQATSEFVSEVLAQAVKSAKKSTDVRRVMLQGMLSVVPGARHVAASEYSVNQQLSENRYEGIGIALGRDHETGLPVINQAFPRAPARLAGAKSKDRILSVDGIDMKGKSLRDYLDALRGLRGEPVSIVVQQPGSDEKRTLDIVRGVIPLESIVGRRRTKEESWDFRAAKESEIAYVNISTIRGSTASEIRQISRKLQADGFRAAVIDMRETNPAADVHHTVMLADALLDGGPIGKVQFTDRQQTFVARKQCAFRDMPLAVLISRGTSRDAEWLAAALQDRERAVIVGQESAGQGITESSFSLLGGDAVAMPTGILLRADGRRLVAPRRQLEVRPIARPAVTARPASKSSRGGVMPDVVVKNLQGQLAQMAVIANAVDLLKKELAGSD